MAIIQASWADLGYRKVGPLPSSNNGLTTDEVVKRVVQHGDYEATNDGWIRRRARKKGALLPEVVEIIDEIDKDTNLNGDRLDFVETWLNSEWLKLDQPEVVTDSDSTLFGLVQKAERDKNRCRGMYKLRQALFHVQHRRLKWFFREHVAPCFFRLYPMGRILVLRYGTELDRSAAIMRSVYAFAQSPLPELAHDFNGIRTLLNWHTLSLTQLSSLLIDLFNLLFYPFIGGVHGGPVGLQFLFLFDSEETYAPAPFPRDWLASLSSSASFGGEKINVFEMIKEYPGPVSKIAGHQRFLHSQKFTVMERVQLLKWYMNSINRLLFELTDVANFTNDASPTSCIDPIFGYEHQLTVDRLLRKTALTISLSEPTVGKLMAFEVADLYDTLNERFEKPAEKTAFFKKLFHPIDGPALISSRLQSLPEPFGTYFSKCSDLAYNELQETVLKSVWLRSKVTANGVMVRSHDLSREVLKPTPDFVAAVMRSYRNAHHGYFSLERGASNRPSRYLYLVDGNLPIEMSMLPVLWWLAYLADPTMVGWKYLPIGVFD